ncbi:MAG TPA: type II toxin-antitoxin system VapC family toxin [Terriglobales bacterium]|jgi:hypothetical protein
MYTAGAPHPNRTAAMEFLERLARNREEICTDAEVLQEIVHRYTKIGRRQEIAALLVKTLAMVDEVMAVGQSEVLRAAEIVQAPQALSARDAIHLASMENRGVRRIFSFDRDFDRWPGIIRMPQD